MKTSQPLDNIVCFLLISFLLAVAAPAGAQGLHGRITDQSGIALPFASLGIPGTAMGTTANIEGDYELTLSPGPHKIRLQYLGYSPKDTIINVGSTYLRINFHLYPESVALPEAIVTSGGEDPAYTIMRRAIAKAKYHSMQVDEYHAMVYVKGSGRLLKVPGIFKKRINKALAEEGIDSTVAFTQESVSKLHYIRPDQYRDTVVSIRMIGDDNNTSPMGFIYSSFYEPKVFSCLSPLAPDAFVHYKFEYLGYITEGDQIINKIKVIPRGRGDQVFEGTIYIVDNVWSIHSLDLTTSIWGIQFKLKQRFEPLAPGVWLPVHEIYDVDGKIFGFAFEYRYFAQLSDYEIKLNPDLEVPVVVLDVKKEKEEAKAAEDKWKKSSFEDGLSKLEAGEELSAKQLRKMMREYEMKELEALPEVDTFEVTGLSQQYVDSTAYKKDSLYWTAIRPMPLTSYEVKGYARQDSIANVPPNLKDDDDEPRDSVSLTLGSGGFQADVKRRSKFQIIHLITGGRYTIGTKAYVKLTAPLQTVNFNTVDGWHLAYELEYGHKTKDRINWSLASRARYNFSRENFNYLGRARLYQKDWSLEFEGGVMPEQFSYDFPITEIENSVYTLFANRNYLKEYEQAYVKGTYKQSFGKTFGVELGVEYSEREHLDNHSDFIIIDSKKLFYTSNDPVFLETQPGALDDHKAIISDLSVWSLPFGRYVVQNGTKRKMYDRSPLISVSYRKGWSNDYDPFDLVMASFRYKWPIGAGSLWSMSLAAGKFFGENKPQYFADYYHLPGNKLIELPSDPVAGFRMLDYYKYSTKDEFAYLLFNYQFRRLALTQFDYFRRQGIRENVIFNSLFTPTSKQYMEVGYALNYVFRILRVEFVTSWQDFRYQNFAVRVGIATDFSSLFSAF